MLHVHKQRFRILKEVCPQWKKIRDLIGASRDGQSVAEPKDIAAYCRDIFVVWLDQHGEKNYPVTWDGVIELLDDVECPMLAHSLKTLVYNN